MKRKIAAALAAAALLAACGSEDAETAETNGSASSNTGGGQAVEMVRAAAEESYVPFEKYNFELRGTDENYMIIIRRGDYDDEISVTVENNRYESKEFVITAPAGYAAYFPIEQKYASSAVNVIKNDIDDTYIPDIMQFCFYISQEELDKDPDNAVYAVSRMYTVDGNGELREIAVVDSTDGENGENTVSDYIDRTQLYHSEPDKFIYEISVDDTNIYDDDGNVRPIEQRVKIKTLTFDHGKNPVLTAGYEEISEDNPLYFGYAYWAAANSAAQYFTMSTFNISDYDNYVEKFDKSGEVSAYYFRIDDPRFSSTDDLHDYLETIFSVSTANRIFEEAPQKYTDIGGELYGIAGDGGYDFTLGTLTFSDMEISDSRMLFRSRQEKYDEDGVFTGYTDGGNFVIARQEDGSWRVIQYRYPYSFN